MLLFFGTSCNKEQPIGSIDGLSSVESESKSANQMKMNLSHPEIDARLDLVDDVFTGDVDFKTVGCSHYFEKLKCSFGEVVVTNSEELADGSIRMSLSGSQTVKEITFSDFKGKGNHIDAQMKINGLDEPFRIKLNGSKAPNVENFKEALLYGMNNGGIGIGTGAPDGAQICPPCIIWAIRGIVILGGLAIADCQAAVAAARANCATPPCTFTAGFCSGTCECPAGNN